MTSTTDILQKILATRKLGSPSLLESEVKGLLAELGVPVPRGVFIPAGEACPALSGLSFPLVAKVAAPAIASKSDVGGVRLGIRDSDALATAVAELQAIDGSVGVLVEEQARPGLEVIVGGAIDPQFGPVVMFGPGGLFVELFRDVAFALAPLGPDQARTLVATPKGAALLSGFRGKPAVDIGALVSIVVIVSELMGSGLIEEIDLNPVLLYPEGGVAVDAKMKLCDRP